MTSDEDFMRRCLALARRAEGRTAPNPIVGCVIVRGGKVIGEGWHHGPGQPHAEIEALAKVRDARGATLYVNLEPCNHHGRTPPCAPAVLASGVKRVVIGAMDPIRGHAGGAKVLARKLEVTTGVLGDECEEANRGFFTAARRGRPFVTLKAGASFDGRVATRTGESKWITGEAARAHGRRFRAKVDAILVGVGTVIADDPQLTSRGRRDPIRVVVDSALRTPPGARMFAPGARRIVATTERAAVTRARRLELAGVEVWTLTEAGGRVDLAALATRLAVEGVHTLLVEGGPSVHASFLAADLVDEVRLYLAPVILGGHGRHAGPSWVGGEGVAHLVQGQRLSFTGTPRRFGDDVLIVARRVT